MGGRERMSKERLERIIRESKGVVWNTETDEDLLAELETPDFDWLSEQAERVEELERELERIKVKYRVTKESHYNCSKSTSELEQQNERYREALEKLTDESLDLWDAVFIAREALEGEGEGRILKVMKEEMQSLK